MNKDAKAAFRITDAVAFGDFLLTDRTRVQAADVGIGLIRRGEQQQMKLVGVATAEAERQFLLRQVPKEGPRSLHIHTLRWVDQQ